MHRYFCNGWQNVAPLFILEYLKRISLPPSELYDTTPPFKSKLDFMFLEVDSFLYNIQKGEEVPLKINRDEIE